MRAVKRYEEFRAVQRESMQVAAVLRKALFSRHSLESPSPEQGGFYQSPSPSGGRSSTPSRGDKSPRRLGTIAYPLVWLRIGAT
jgi:hypothetical protein